MKKFIVFVLVFVSICSSYSFADAVSNLNIYNDMTYLENLENVSFSRLKEEIDYFNKELDKLYSNYIITNNGIRIYTSNTIDLIDRYNKGILLRLEYMRYMNKKNTDDFYYIRYPLVSEVEIFGVPVNYSEYFDTERFFRVPIDDQYIENKADYNYFKEVSLDKFIASIELLDFIDFDGVRIFFNPYKILSSYAYYDNYSPDDIPLRRCRIYINPNDGEDIISTIYHELGHVVYNELVLNNKMYYDEYYKIYKNEFDKYGAENDYGSWEYKLTENFAEDFKIYVTRKVLGKAKWLDDFVSNRYHSFLEKDTVYEINPKIFSYFDKILKDYKVDKTSFRPDISIKLNDYKEEFNYRNESYLGDYINKIVTNSSDVIININEDTNKNVNKNVNKSVINFCETAYIKNIDKLNTILFPKKITLYKQSRNEEFTPIKTVNSIKKGIKFSINGHNTVYKIEILLKSPCTEYSETVTYYLVKHNI